MLDHSGFSYTLIYSEATKKMNVTVAPVREPKA